MSQVHDQLEALCHDQGTAQLSISKRGEVVVLAASKEFEELGRVDLGERTFATPAIAGGVIYLRTQSRLYSLGKAK